MVKVRKCEDGVPVELRPEVVYRQVDGTRGGGGTWAGETANDATDDETRRAECTHRQTLCGVRVDTLTLRLRRKTAPGWVSVTARANDARVLPAPHGGLQRWRGRATSGCMGARGKADRAMPIRAIETRTAWHWLRQRVRRRRRLRPVTIVRGPRWQSR